MAMSWLKKLKGKVRLAEPLKNHTTFKIGGPAKFFIEPKDTQDLRNLILSARACKIPIFLIGAGSNILVSDKGVRGVVLCLSSVNFKKMSAKGRYLCAGAGLLLRQFLSKAQERGLSGAEFLAGIPGTIGGALAMNAGAGGSCIGNLVESVRVMDWTGSIKIMKRKDIRFSYRSSNLSRYIILEACFRLDKKNKSLVRQNIAKYLNLRRNAQDVSLPNAGCIFRNPTTKQAGLLIDLCGLKGKSAGSVKISEKHANFILNKGNAKAVDVLKLMRLIKKKVKERFKIDLKPEIKIWR